VHGNQMPDGKMVRGVQYLQLPRSHKDSKDWTTEFYRDSRQVVLKLKLLFCCHRNPKRKLSGPLNRIWKNEADPMANEAFGTEI